MEEGFCVNSGKQRKVGIILSYLTIIVSTLVQLLYTPLLIRMLGQSEYGLYSLVSSIIGYLTVLDLGFGNAIIVYTTKFHTQGKFDDEKKLHGMFKIVFSIIGLIAVLLGGILYLNVNNLFGNTMNSLELEKMKIMMLILVFNLAITFPFSIYSSIINAYEKFTFQKVLSILNTILKPILMIPLLFMGYKSISLCVIITIVNLMVLLSNYFYCRSKLDIRIKYMGFDKTLFKAILGYSIWIFLGIIVDKVNWSVDQFVLGAVSGTIAVSIYSVASQINTLFINLSTAVSGVMLPKVTKMIANNETTDKLSNEFIKVGRIQYYIIFLMVSGFTLVGKDFIILWAGKEFEVAYYVTLILIIPISFPLIQNLGISVMQALNKYKFKSISTFIMAIANIFISIYLAKRYGPIGSAIGTSIALVICNIILINIYYHKVININVIKFWKNIFEMTMWFIIPVALVLVLMFLTKLDGITGILVYSFVYTIMYGIICLLFVMNEYEKTILNKVFKKFRVR